MKKTGLGLFGFHGADSAPQVLTCDYDHYDKEFTTQKDSRKNTFVGNMVDFNDNTPIVNERVQVYAEEFKLDMSIFLQILLEQEHVQTVSRGSKKRRDERHDDAEWQGD
jgi:hypothetical protein